MSKLEKLEREEQKAREKIEELQKLLRGLASQKTEQENLQIVQMVRALKLTREELYEFLKKGALPASIDSSNNAQDQETIYSRRSKKETENSESEEITNEDQSDN